jgi:hypothetical protein
MRDQQLEQELEPLGPALERLHEKLDFRLVRLKELVPGRLRYCLTKGVSFAAVIRRRNP